MTIKKIWVSIKSGHALWWAGILAAAILVYSIGITHEGIWYDEACSAVMAEHPLAQIPALASYDNHPPLYYMLLRLARVALGDSVWALRALSVAGAVALIALGAGPVRRIFGQRTAFLYAAVILCTPAMLIYAHEARMYTLAIFAVTASALYGYLAVRENRAAYWICFGLTSLAAAYLHYYGLLAACCTHLFVFSWILLRKRALIKAFLATGTAVAAGYLPWLGTMIQQTQGVQKGFWLPPLQIGDVLQAFYKPFVYKDGYPGLWWNMQAAVALAILLAAGGVVLALRKRAQPEAGFSALLLFVYFGTLAAAVVVSLTVAPIFYTRYMMVCMGLFLFLISLGIHSLPGRKWPLAALGIFFLLNVSTIRDVYTQHFNFTTKEGMLALQREIRPGDLIITTESYSLGPAMYYFPQAEHYYSSNDHEARFGHVLLPFVPPLHYDEGLANLLATRSTFYYITCSTGLAKSIWTVLKGESGWEEVPPAKTYADAYSPVSFTAQKFIHSGRAAVRRGTLTVHLTGLKPKASLYVALYNQSAPFWTGPLAKTPPPFRYQTVVVDSPELTYTFDGLEYGEYALVMAHDENENHSVDFDRAKKYPVEGVFIQNFERMDLSRGWGDFSFEKSKFQFQEPEMTLQGRMLYPPFPGTESN